MKNCEESAETEKTTGQERDKSIASEESDDDILPPAIFYKPKRFSEICTPTKVSTPANNDLSPITPSEEIVQSKKKKRRRLCFKKLVKEKAAQDEIDRKLSKMNEELKEGLENGGIFNMILHEERNRTDGDLSDESQDASDLLPQHKKELDKNIEKMNEGFGNDFPDGFPGDVLFFYQPCSVDLQPPKCIKELMGVQTSGTRNIPSNETDPLTEEFLMSGFLIDLVMFKKNVDPCILDWLLRCMCFSTNFEVIEASYNALWAFVASSNEELKWHFTTEKFLSLLAQMGASESQLATSSLFQQFCHFQSDIDHGPARPPDLRLSAAFLHCLQTLLKSFSYYMKKIPGIFSKSDIMLNILLGLRLGIAKEINACVWEAEVYIGCAIDLYSEEDWEEEAPHICKCALELTDNHSNRLQMVEVIPGTSRGREFKKLLALTMLQSTVSSRAVDISCFGRLLRNSAVSKVLEMVSQIHTNQETDFHKLFSMISFVNHCTPDESITSTDKRKLDNLITVLRRLNGEIRDPGGYYMNRTKVKDLIIRTLNRLTHVFNGLQTQSSLDGFFGEKKSNFKQLKFETLEDQPDKVGMPEDDNSDDLESHVASSKQVSGLKRKASSSDVSKSSGTDDEDFGDDDDEEEIGESDDEDADDEN